MMPLPYWLMIVAGPQMSTLTYPKQGPSPEFTTAMPAATGRRPTGSRPMRTPHPPQRLDPLTRWVGCPRPCHSPRWWPGRVLAVVRFGSTRWPLRAASVTDAKSGPVRTARRAVINVDGESPSISLRVRARRPSPNGPSTAAARGCCRHQAGGRRRCRRAAG